MLRLPSPFLIAVLVALALVALLLPLLGGPYAIKFATRVMVLALFVLSLDLLIGITGLVSFGHAIFLGVGAYTIYFVSPASEPVNAAWAFPLAMLAGAAAALAVGAVAVLTRGFYFIMVTLAFGEMSYALFHDTSFAGGSDGAYINIKPQIALGSWTLLDFEHRVTFHYFCLALLVAAFVLVFALSRGPFGRVLQGIRWNETRVAALGFNGYAHKLTSFTIAGSLAGLAGALFASIDGYVTPDLFGWRQSGFAIMMVVLGGVGTLSGAILGAIAYAGLEEVLKTASLVGPVANHWSMALGLVLIAAVLAAPRGIAGAFARLGPEPVRERPAQPAAAALAPPRPAPAVATENLSRRFGGLIAVDAVSVALPSNRVHAIIGPNGAGKTTFINLLSGALRPTGGRILLDGRDVAGLPAHAMARRGVGRSYQITNVILPFSVAENCRLAAQAQALSPFRLRSGARAAAEHAGVAAALRAVGLAERENEPAAHLSHGEQRQLEIAMLIASGARLLVLDEPLAGMGAEETGRVTALLRALREDHTLILIEHDLDAVFAAADTLTVLLGGRLLAHGEPAAVRNDPAVREAYLGRYGEQRQAGA